MRCVTVVPDQGLSAIPRSRLQVPISRVRRLQHAPDHARRRQLHLSLPGPQSHQATFCIPVSPHVPSPPLRMYSTAIFRNDGSAWDDG